MKIPLFAKCWSIALLVSSVATFLYWQQGGFGGGHGRFDLALLILGFPWALISWPEGVMPNDFSWVIAIPLAFNLVVGAELHWWFGRRSRRHASRTR